MNYCKAESLEGFFQAAAEAEGLVRPLAGGADIMYRLKKRFLKADRLTLIDINSLDELKGITETAEELEIGSATTLAELLAFLRDRQGFSLLETALYHAACPQIRNQGTLGGHLVGCLPNSHIYPALMAYDARVRILDTGGERSVPVEELFRGPYHSRLKSGELITSVFLTRRTFTWESYWGEGQRKDFSLAPFVLVQALGPNGRRTVVGGASNFIPVHFRILESAPQGFGFGKPSLMNWVNEEVSAQEGRMNRLTDYQKNGPVSPHRGDGRSGGPVMSDVMNTKKVTLRLKVNGRNCSLETPVETSLARVLRDGLGLLATKEGCGAGTCGSCTVLVDGKAMKSCIVLAASVQGRDIVTVEGLSSPGHPMHPVQQAFVEAGAIQCGFCTPGFVMSTYALLLANPDPTDEEIKKGLSGNLCRCTGYETILAAVKHAARKMAHPKPGTPKV